MHKGSNFSTSSPSLFVFWVVFHSCHPNGCKVISHCSFDCMRVYAQLLSCIWFFHELQPARLLCTWNFPSKNTGVGCHFLLQGIFQTQRLNPHLLYLLLWQADSLPLSCHWSPFPERLVGLLCWLSGKEPASNVGDVGLTPGSGRFAGEGNGCPLQYSCFGNPMNRGAWQATFHRVGKESKTT